MGQTGEVMAQEILFQAIGVIASIPRVRTSGKTPWDHVKDKPAEPNLRRDLSSEANLCQKRSSSQPGQTFSAILTYSEGALNEMPVKERSNAERDTTHE